MQQTTQIVKKRIANHSQVWAFYRGAYALDDHNLVITRRSLVWGENV